MNTRSTRRDLADESELDTDEQRPTGSVLDELIEQQLRKISDQNELYIQQTGRFNQIIGQYEERIVEIEEKQEQIVRTVQNLNENMVGLVKRTEAIEARSKACEEKCQASQAELMTRVQQALVKELQLFDARTLECVQRLGNENQELSLKIERLGRETASLRTSLEARSDHRTRQQTLICPEPRISTPLPHSPHRAGVDSLPVGQLPQSTSVRSGTSTMKDGNLIRKPNMYDGQTSWEAYYAQFCIIAEMNGWDEEQKAAFLATSLKGTALQVLANLSNDRRQSFGALVAALSSRFGTSHRTEISKVKFKNRVRQRDEELPALAEDIERLARLAYPDAPQTIIDTLARDQFVDSLPDDDMRLRLRQERPPNLQRALELALELESFRLASRQQRVRITRETKIREEPKERNSGSSTLDIAKRMEAASNQIAKSMERLEILMKERRGSRKSSREPRSTECWRCGAEGHFRASCPERSPSRNRRNADGQFSPRDVDEKLPRRDLPSAESRETGGGVSLKGSSGNAT